MSAYSSNLFRSSTSSRRRGTASAKVNSPSGAYALWMLVSTLGAGYAYHQMDVGDPTTSLSIFMIFVVTARFGLYGLELGCLEIQQKHCDEQSRASIGSVESSLCALFTLLVYAAGLFLPPTSIADGMDSSGLTFRLLVDLSVFFVSCACIIHLAWVTCWQEEQHPHEAVSLVCDSQEGEEAIMEDPSIRLSASAVPHSHASQHDPPFLQGTQQLLSATAAEAAIAAGQSEAAGNSTLWYTLYSDLIKDDDISGVGVADATVDNDVEPSDMDVRVLKQRVEHTHLVYKGPKVCNGLFWASLAETEHQKVTIGQRTKQRLRSRIGGRCGSNSGFIMRSLHGIHSSDMGRTGTRLLSCPKAPSPL